MGYTLKRILSRMELSDLVTPLKRQTLSANVYDQLRDLVMSGQMMPGEQISLRSAAAALGVSVMPVREAMQRLVAEQALELTPSRTLRVPRMTAAQFKEITVIRTNLEGWRPRRRPRRSAPWRCARSPSATMPSSPK